MPTIDMVGRRDFLKKSAAGGAGLVIGLYLPGKYEALAGVPPTGAAPINAWVQIAPDDTTTLMIDKSEMGQGINTALTMILADELDLDWKKIKTEFAPAAPVYFNPVFGLQGTGGSSAMAMNAPANVATSIAYAAGSPNRAITSPPTAGPATSVV